MLARLRIALLAVWTLALPASDAFAQLIFGPGMNGTMPDKATPGQVNDDGDLDTCYSSAGGSRVRSGCEAETTTKTLRFEQEFNLEFELAAVLESVQCGATTTTEYLQRNTIARVNSTIEIADCTAASGAFTVELRTKDDSGEEKPLEFSETWQRSDDHDVDFTADYPIGENVELVSVRLRRLSCTCADPPTDDEAAASDLLRRDSSTE